jgi:vacuolar protein sorting-associated protein 13A/C
MDQISDEVRFLDDVDLTVSIDNRGSAQDGSVNQLMSVELAVKPVTLRASYRDINLVSSIVNKAAELYSKSQPSQASSRSPQTSVKAVSTSQPQLSRSTTSRPLAASTHVLVSKEQVCRDIISSCPFSLSLRQVKGTFDGFRLVLIGDLHEQPMLHLKVKPFVVGVKDWSSEVSWLLLW